MTRSEFIDEVAAQSGLSKREAAQVVDALLETITNNLSEGGEVSLPGFGKFSVSERSARAGVNPSTGERIQIEAARVPKFSAGSGLKRAVSLAGKGETPF